MKKIMLIVAMLLMAVPVFAGDQFGRTAQDFINEFSARFDERVRTGTVISYISGYMAYDMMYVIEERGQYVVKFGVQVSPCGIELWRQFGAGIDENTYGSNPFSRFDVGLIP